MCLAAERVAGQGSMVGAQQINVLWRIYPATREARSQLLVQGIQIRGSVLQVASTNPFILRNDSGEEKPSTKVFIDNIPISVADSEIEHSLLKVGCELRSSIKCERARDSDNKLTRFLTGRRFVFVTVPPVPLEKTLKVSFFTAKIYHREQKFLKKSVVCSKCLEQNHHASECEKEIVCRACRKTGHKRGDSVCDISFADQPRRESVSVTVVREENESDVQSEERQKVTKRDKQLRGRSTARQATLGTSLELRSPPRHRSETPKRRRSRETSPAESAGNKQAKRDGVRSDHCDTPDSDLPDVEECR